MTNVDIKPTRFIKVGTEIEAKFLDEEDTLKWYKGFVKKVGQFGEDVQGSYVTCVVLYDDGEEVKDSVFYDKDFDENDSMDAWRFYGNITQLMSFMVKNTAEVRALKAALKENEQKVIAAIQGVLDVIEDSDSEEEDQDPVPRKKSIVGVFPALIIVFLAFAAVKYTEYVM